ncbi:hypothetical protein [Kitasatospora sp. NPDC088779]|uniref:hypothetical protein n=1 Tax=unclassified Kitasatospora TaxID=2633591 RepID=UPI003449F1C4
MDPTATAHALATALSQHGIPAERTDLSGDRAVAVELTIRTSPAGSRDYHVLYLEPDDQGDTVLWQLTTAHGEITINGTGAWHIPDAPLLTTEYRHQHTVTALSGWMKERGARPGAPALPPTEVLLSLELQGWELGLLRLTAAYAEALISGQATADTTPADLAALHPELTARYDNPNLDGWHLAGDAIRALADGRVTEDTSAASDHIDVTPDLVNRYGPRALARLRQGFDGDVLAAARFFLAANTPISDTP